MWIRTHAERVGCGFTFKGVFSFVLGSDSAASESEESDEEDSDQEKSSEQSDSGSGDEAKAEEDDDEGAGDLDRHAEGVDDTKSDGASTTRDELSNMGGEQEVLFLKLF